MAKGVKEITRGLPSDTWLFEIGKKISVLKKQRLFLTRGHKYTGVFSFPAASLKTLHRRILREGYSITLEEFRKCPFVLEARGVKIGEEWINFDRS